MLTPLLLLTTLLLALTASALPAHIRDLSPEGAALSPSASEYVLTTVIDGVTATFTSVPTGADDNGVYEAVHTEIIVLIVLLAVMVLAAAVGAGIYLVRRRRAATARATTTTDETLSRTRSDASARTLVATLEKDGKSVHSL